MSFVKAAKTPQKTEPIAAVTTSEREGPSRQLDRREILHPGRLPGQPGTEGQRLEGQRLERGEMEAVRAVPSLHLLTVGALHSLSPCPPPPFCCAGGSNKAWARVLQQGDLTPDRSSSTWSANLSHGASPRGGERPFPLVTQR